MFDKMQLDALYEELDRTWQGKPEHEQLVRDAHLAIALSDAGRPLDDGIDARVVALIEAHRPQD